MVTSNYPGGTNRSRPGKTTKASNQGRRAINWGIDRKSRNPRSSDAAGSIFGGQQRVRGNNSNGSRPTPRPTAKRKPGRGRS